MVLGTIGLGGCDNDEDLPQEVYQGYIIKNSQPGGFLIKITYSPYNRRPERDMPLKDELIISSTPDTPDLELEVNQKVSFKILSVESVFMPFIYDPTTYPSWICKIIILKNN